MPLRAHRHPSNDGRRLIQKVLMSLASLFAETEAALRLQFGGFKPSTIDLKPLRPRLPMSGNGPRGTDAEILRPFARQVCMDMQIAGGLLDSRAAWANEANRLDR